MLRSLAAASAAARRRLLHLGSGVGGGGEEVESMSYRMSMLRAPPVERKKVITSNSCSLIGRLVAPVRPHNDNSEDDPRAYTFLSVPRSSSSSPSSSSPSPYSPIPPKPPNSVTLQLEGNLAKVCLKHLKHNDLVYVSGLLNSYHKVSASGERYICYKIHVKELNYVLDLNKKPWNDEDSADPASTHPVDPQILQEKKCTDRLRLWQVFFASPYEWWDNRQSKPHVNYPDFKHKDTREGLWLHPNDPPWVRKQLELHDQEIAENGLRYDRRRLTNHRWNAQDFNYSDERQKDEQDIWRQANA